MLSNLLSELRSTSKPAEKIAVLNRYEEAGAHISLFAFATFDPFTLFHVRVKPKDIPEPGDHEADDLISEIDDVFYKCTISNSNKQNRELVIDLLSKLNAGSQELVVATINKNWKAGVSTKTILKAFPGLVKEFLVQLANTYNFEKHSDKIAGRRWSYKMDGLRCIAIRWSIDGWKMYSRKGKEFHTLDHIKEELEWLYQNGIEVFGDKKTITFWDGEIYKKGLSFEEIQGLTMGFTKGTAYELEYHTFAGGQYKSFFEQNKEDIIDWKMDHLHKFKDHVFAVETGIVNSVDEMNEQLEKAFDLGYEGIMLRHPNISYDFKRSDALLKVKQFEEEGEIISDAVIREVKVDNFPVIENGKMTHEKLITRLEVEQEDGIMCGVGSGFDLDFRRGNPEELVGKKIEVKHQYWGKNGRMRFPRLYRIREDL